MVKIGDTIMYHYLQGNFGRNIREEWARSG